MLIRNYISSTRGEQAGYAVGGVQVSGARYEICSWVAEEAERYDRLRTLTSTLQKRSLHLLTALRSGTHSLSPRQPDRG